MEIIGSCLVRLRPPLRLWSPRWAPSSEGSTALNISRSRKCRRGVAEALSDRQRAYRKTRLTISLRHRWADRALSQPLWQIINQHNHLCYCCSQFCRGLSFHEPSLIVWASHPSCFISTLHIIISWSLLHRLSATVTSVPHLPSPNGKEQPTSIQKLSIRRSRSRRTARAHATPVPITQTAQARGTSLLDSSIEIRTIDQKSLASYVDYARTI